MNYKVIIDSGHGGDDPGAVNNNYNEKDYNLKISKYINKRLNDLGVENVLVRDDDITLSPTERIKKINTLYDNNKKNLVISNHINAGGVNGQSVTNV